jgi:hypothetical protein
MMIIDDTEVVDAKDVLYLLKVKEMECKIFYNLMGYKKPQPIYIGHRIFWKKSEMEDYLRDRSTKEEAEIAATNIIIRVNLEEIREEERESGKDFCELAESVYK